MTKPLSKERCNELIDEGKMWYKLHKAKNCVQNFFDEKGLQYKKVMLLYGLNNRQEVKIFVDAYIGIIDKKEA